VECIREHPSWRSALAELQTTRTILLLGATDTGKTTFLTWLANTLYGQGRRVAVLDADIGQSSIGPPTTIGLGIVVQPMQHLQEVATRSVFFVGSTSPRGHLLPMVVGTRRMLDRALTLDVEHVIIDTCGFITGHGGRALQRYTIGVVNPDVVVCLQQRDECEGLLRAYRRRQRPRVLRLPASPARRHRSMEERRVFRQRALQRYFAKPTSITLPWDDLDLIDTPLWCGVPLARARSDDLCHPECPEILWMERDGRDLLVVTRAPLPPSGVAEIERTRGLRVQTWSMAALHGTLLGLLDHTAEVIGLGMLRRIDFTTHCLEILSTGAGHAIAGVQWSQTQVSSLLGAESASPWSGPI
jgi:polynucleotide 5'-hydroxyl-kinase GRC3/NOL9